MGSLSLGPPTALSQLFPLKESWGWGTYVIGLKELGHGKKGLSCFSGPQVLPLFSSKEKSQLRQRGQKALPAGSAQAKSSDPTEAPSKAIRWKWT